MKGRWGWLSLLLAAMLVGVVDGTAQDAPVSTGLSTDPGQSVHFDAPKNLRKGVPTIWLVGDSTVRNGRGDGANNQMGWGDELGMFFDPAKVNIVNRAIGGRSSRSYISEGHWAELLPLIQAGDVVIFQFGHNDGGAIDDPARARASWYRCSMRSGCRWRR